MAHSRPPAVAGMFYPGESGELEEVVRSHLGELPQSGPRPVALIAPHAGLIYSGPIAGSAYRLIHPIRDRIRRVALFGPSHRVPLSGVAVPAEDHFLTPLGEIPLALAVIDRLRGLPGVMTSSEAHRNEHSLEVQLPFLQQVLGEFELIPVVVGISEPDAVAEIMEACLDDDTLLVISSDLSHFHDYPTAQAIDATTAGLIRGRSSELVGEQACGCQSVNGLMALARRRDWQVEQLDLRNSGDTAGSHDRVVGYGAFALYGAA